jgi:hypothetical protein
LATLTHTWSTDDDVLVIALYHRHGALTVDRSEARTHARIIDTTPESVAAALANVRCLDTGTGLDNASSHMRSMWEVWGHRPAETAIEADAARKRLDAASRPHPVPELSPKQQARIHARRAQRRHDG